MAIPDLLKGELVRLRSVQPDDHLVIDSWIADMSSPFWSNTALLFDSYGQYVELVVSRGLAEFALLVVNKGNEQPIGLMRIRNVDLGKGHATLDMFVIREYHAAPQVVHALALLVDYLFRAASLRKIYVESTERFECPPCALLSLVGDQEACFSGHLLFGSEALDVHLFAIYADRWPDLRQRLWDR